MRGVRPIWMDVMNRTPIRSSTPTGIGWRDGRSSGLRGQEDPYRDGIKRNLWTVDRDGVLVWSVGHVHTGGLRPTFI